MIDKLLKFKRVKEIQYLVLILLQFFMYWMFISLKYCS